jgi:MFS family permease
MTHDRRQPTEQEQRVQQSLSISWREGIAAQVMIGIMDYFTTPFALLLGATTQEIGVLVAFPNLLASLVQVFAVRAVQWAGSRMQLLITGLLIQSFFLLPIGALSYFNFSGRLILLTAFVTVYKVIGAVIGPAWGSLVSEYLPPHRRGNYFGWRARVVGLSGLINMVVWGVFLYFWKKRFDAASGFLVIFVAAGLARFVSLSLMSRMVELPHHATRGDDFTFWMFLRRFRESNFVKYVFFVSGITFATNICSPYFSVHMLRDLHFNYLNYMAVSLASVVMGLICFPMWGRHADSIGNARILKITSAFIWLIPVLWLFPQTVGPLICIEMFSGFIWGGFNLCATNFIFDAVSPAKRVRCLGYFNFINGTALFAGAWLGGWLGARVPPLMGHPLPWIFVVSAVVRLLASTSLSRHFKEVRTEAKPVTSGELFFSVVGIRTLFGRNEETLTAGSAGFPRRDKEPPGA